MTRKDQDPFVKEGDVIELNNPESLYAKRCPGSKFIIEPKQYPGLQPAQDFNFFAEGAQFRVTIVDTKYNDYRPGKQVQTVKAVQVTPDRRPSGKNPATPKTIIFQQVYECDPKNRDSIPELTSDCVIPTIVEHHQP